MIRFQQFGWRFAGAAGWALQDVTLSIGRGEFVAVAGPSGSGKTTLALAMCGLLVGRHAGDAVGSIHVGGRDVTAMALHEVAQRVALVQQNPEAQFATLRVEDEIAFGLENRCQPPDEIRRRVADALSSLDVGHLAGRELAGLSGGEKQRVAVASIIAARPDAIVLDEPTASLDPQVSRNLFGTLAELCNKAGLTVIIIEHKLAQLISLCSRWIELRGGRVSEACPESALNRQYIKTDSHPECKVRGEGSGAGPSFDRCTPVVQASHVTVQVGPTAALDDVSLEVHPGEAVAVLGPNGGGKTTLLNMVVGLARPARGNLRVCGRPVPQTPVSQLARSVGLVFQNADHQLVGDTVWHDAVFAAQRMRRLDEPTRATAERLLERAGLLDRAEDHPFRLSWGQKRRLNVISAVLHRPRLLLLDEPFAGQDWENAGFLLEVIRQVTCRRQGTVPATGAGTPEGACLLVTHDPRVVLRSCTRVLFLENGRLVVDLPTREAFARLRETGHDAYAPRPMEMSTPAAGG